MKITKEQPPSESKPGRLSYGPLAAMLVTVSTYFASQVIAGIVLSLIPLLTGWNQTELDEWLTNSVGAQFLAVALVAATTLGIILWFLRMRNVKLPGIGLKRPGLRDVWYGAIGYGLYIMAFIVLLQIVAAAAPGLDLEQEQDLLFDRQTTGPALWLIFISLVMLPAIIEEIVFRGFLYSGLRSRFRVIPAAIITSLLFAVVHLQAGSGNPLLWVAALDTFVLSAVLIYTREKTGGLTSPMLIHFTKNSLAFTFVFLV